jgi:hypothetical protein
MSNTQLLQIIQAANARIPSDFLNQTAKAIWQTVSAPLKALHAIGPDPDSPPSSVFLGDAFAPSADGTSSNVELRRGLAIVIDGSVGGTWDGDVKPIYADVDQVVSFSQNTDASGDDRIDKLVIRPAVEEENPQTVYLKDTLEGAVYTQTRNTRRVLGFELQVLEGTPNAAPTAPVTPSGWTAICTVLRPNGQANVLSGDITDMRTLDVLRAATFIALAGCQLGDGDEFGQLTYDEVAEAVEVKDAGGNLEDLKVDNLAANGVSADNVMKMGGAFYFATAPNNGDAATLGNNFNIASATYRENASEKYVEVVPVEPVNSGYFVATCGAFPDGAASIDAVWIAGEVDLGSGTYVAKLFFYDSSGNLVKPPSGNLQYHSFTYFSD